MAGLETRVAAAVDSAAKTHATNATAKAAKAATPDNGGTDTDVQSQIDAVLIANPPSWLFLEGAFAILGIGLAAGYVVWRLVRPTDFLPSSNYAVYAGLFIVALAIEQILEPFAGYIVPSTTQKKAQAKATVAKVTRAKAAVPDVPAVALAPAPEALTAVTTATATAAVQTTQLQAAGAEKEHHRSPANRAVLMGALASTLAIVVYAWVGIFLLRVCRNACSHLDHREHTHHGSRLPGKEGPEQSAEPLGRPGRHRTRRRGGNEAAPRPHHQHPVVSKRRQIDVDVDLAGARQAPVRSSMCWSSIQSGIRNQM